MGSVSSIVLSPVAKTSVNDTRSRAHGQRSNNDMHYPSILCLIRRRRVPPRPGIVARSLVGASLQAHPCPAFLRPNHGFIVRYAEMVNERARRLLPALSRSHFSAPTNTDDSAAAEVRSVLAEAWLSRHSDFDDPFAGAAATGAISESLSGGHMVRPWHLAKELLRMHVTVCRVSERYS